MSQLDSSAEPAAALRRPRFDGTITLGHVMQLLAMGGAILTMFVSFRDSVRELDARVKYLERSQGSLTISVEKLTDNQTQIARTADRLSFAIESMLKKP